MPRTPKNGPSAEQKTIQELERRLAEAEAALQALSAEQAQPQPGDDGGGPAGDDRQALSKKQQAKAVDRQQLARDQQALAHGQRALAHDQQTLDQEKQALARDQEQMQGRLLQVDSDLAEANLRLENSKLELEIELAERERAEAELTILQRRTQEILSSIRDGFMALDRKWRFIYVNERAAENSGLRPKELIGRNIWEMFPALIGTPLEKHYRRAMRSHTPANFEIGGMATHTWYDVSVYPSEEGITIYWRDKTAQKQAAEEAETLRRQMEAERALFGAVIENAPEGIVVADSQARIVMSNPAAERLYARPVPIGQEHSSHAQMQLCDPSGRPIPPRDLPLTRSALDGKAFADVEMIVVWPDGQRRSLLVTTAPIVEASDKVTGAVGIFRDITERLRLNEQLQAERARLDAILRQLPVGVMIVDAPSGRPVMSNVQLDLIWRQPFNASAGKPDLSAYARYFKDGRMYTVEEWPLMRALRSGEVITNEEVIIQRGDGETGIVAISASPVFNLEGDIIAVVAVYHDITAQKEMEAALRKARDELAQRVVERTLELNESEVRLSAVIHSLPVLLWTIDRQGVMTMIAGRRMAELGLTEEKLLGSDTLEYAAGDPGVVDSIRRALAGETVVHVAPSITRPDMVFQTHYLPQFGLQGQVTGVIGLGIDITERARAEAELNEYHNRLEELVRERTLALEQEIHERELVELSLQGYAERLERSNRDLQDFAFIASHDLQEPLRKIQAFGERLTTRYGKALEPEGRDYVERMRKAAFRMNSMIQDLLAYSRVSTRTEPFTPVDLLAVAQEVVSDLETTIEATRGRVEIGELPVVEADPGQMAQLFQNLLSNALKFHRKEVAPVVKVWCRQVSEQEVEILVEDNGIGFDMQYLERVFQPFQRLHGRSEFEGSGVGLPICRRIAERHGGGVTARSAPGQGAEFIVTLPLHH